MGSLDLNKEDKITLITSERANLNLRSNPKISIADLCPTVASSPLLKKTVTGGNSTQRFDRRAFRSIDFTKVPSTSKNISIEVSNYSKLNRPVEASDIDMVRKRGNSLM